MLYSPTASTWADPVIAGGGYAHAQLSHATGLLFWLTDLRARSVYAEMSAPGTPVELYDALTVRFTNGAIGAVSGAGRVPAGGSFQLDIRLFGDEGMLLLDVERERLEVRRNDGALITTPVTPGEGAYTCDGPPIRFSGVEAHNDSPRAVAARSVELLDAAYRSARQRAIQEVG